LFPERPGLTAQLSDMTRKRALQTLLAALAVALGAGCSLVPEHVPEGELPRFVQPAKPPKVVLVLGSGGPRGFAHIGVLKVLDAAGIRPDYVVGSSIGALVGAFHAGGFSGLDLEAMALDTSPVVFLDVSAMWNAGKSKGIALQSFVQSKLEGRPMQGLGTGAAAVATRMRDGATVTFNQGHAGLAVRASSAIDDLFLPVSFGGETYVDGDESSPVPVRAARKLGAVVVIAVDVSAYVENTPQSVPEEWRARDRKRAAMIAAESGGADVVIHPDIGYYAGGSVEYRKKLIAIAEQATREALPAIQAAIARAVQPAGVTSR
jgi:NTE family protein